MLCVFFSQPFVSPPFWCKGIFMIFPLLHHCSFWVASCPFLVIVCPCPCVCCDQCKSLSLSGCLSCSERPQPEPEPEPSEEELMGTVPERALCVCVQCGVFSVVRLVWCVQCGVLSVCVMCPSLQPATTMITLMLYSNLISYWNCLCLLDVEVP